MSLFRDLLRTSMSEAGRVARRGAARAARKVLRTMPSTAGDTKGSTASALARHPGSVRTADGHESLPDRSAVATLRITYDPVPDALPDPGEVVWAWVHYEETLHEGKDRPILVLTREGTVLVCLMLTSQDHGRGRTEDRHGNDWFDIGTGSWDPEARPSEVRLDRLLQIDPQEVRRIGAVLPQGTFHRVADAVRKVHGW